MAVNWNTISDLHRMREWGAKFFSVNSFSMIELCFLGHGGSAEKLCKQYLTRLDKAKFTGISLLYFVNNTIGFYHKTGYSSTEE